MDGDSVYVCFEREFIKLREPVVKVGRSGAVDRRAKQYPKGSVMAAVLAVTDMHVVEAALLTAFRASPLFAPRPDIGTEYFECRASRDMQVAAVHAARILFDVALPFIRWRPPPPAAPVAEGAVEEAVAATRPEPETDTETESDAVEPAAEAEAEPEADSTVPKAPESDASVPPPADSGLSANPDMLECVSAFLRAKGPDLLGREVPMDALWADFRAWLATVAGEPVLKRVSLHRFKACLVQTSKVKILVNDLSTSVRFPGKPSSGAAPGEASPPVCRLSEFLSMDPVKRGLAIERVEGHVAWVEDLKAADKEVLAQYGFYLSDKTVNVCHACKQMSRRGKCCTEFDWKRRPKKWLIHNMRLHSITTQT